MLAIDATIDALLPEWPHLPSESRMRVSADCARFVRRQISLSPAHIRFGIGVLFAAFCLFAFLRLGARPLGSVPRERRTLALRAFAHERVAPLIALERVLRSMTMVAYLDHADVLAAIAEAPLSASEPAAWGAAEP